MPRTSKWQAQHKGCQAAVDHIKSERDELLTALTQACEAVGWLLEHWPTDEDPGPGIRTDLARWRNVLSSEAPGRVG
jgi:hypothetical protein